MNDEIAVFRVVLMMVFVYRHGSDRFKTRFVVMNRVKYCPTTYRQAIKLSADRMTSGLVFLKVRYLGLHDPRFVSYSSLLDRHFLDIKPMTARLFVKLVIPVWPCSTSFA